MEQVTNEALAELIQQANEQRFLDLTVGQAHTKDGVVTLHLVQKFVNPPKKVLIEVVSGFDVVARKEFEIEGDGFMGVINFKLAALSPATRVIAIRNKYEGDGSHDRVYMQHIQGYWQGIFWKTFMEDVMYLETTYKRKYRHW